MADVDEVIAGCRDVGSQLILRMWWECDDERGRARLCRPPNMYIYSSTHPV